MSKQAALNELLTNIDAEDCVEILDEFWECWITHDQTDSTTAQRRAARLGAYKDMRRFLTTIARKN